MTDKKRKYFSGKIRKEGKNLEEKNDKKSPRWNT
jgi:hypothetical protein